MRRYMSLFNCRVIATYVPMFLLIADGEVMKYTSLPATDGVPIDTI